MGDEPLYKMDTRGEWKPRTLYCIHCDKKVQVVERRQRKHMPWLFLAGWITIGLAWLVMLIPEVSWHCGECGGRLG